MRARAPHLHIQTAAISQFSAEKGRILSSSPIAVRGGCGEDPHSVRASAACARVKAGGPAPRSDRIDIGPCPARVVSTRVEQWSGRGLLTYIDLSNLTASLAWPSTKPRCVYVSVHVCLYTCLCTPTLSRRSRTRTRTRTRHPITRTQDTTHQRGGDVFRFGMANASADQRNYADVWQGVYSAWIPPPTEPRAPPPSVAP